MAIMYPNLISDTKSDAEKNVFKWLRDDPKTNDWIVLHSYPIFQHKTLIIGEADFVILAPKLGLFVLEIKGGLVERIDGVWYFTGKHGKSEGKKRGPFEQGEEGVQSIVKIIQDKFGRSSINGRILFGFGCVFPDMIFDYSSPEYDKRIIFDQRNGTKIGDFVIGLSKVWKEKIINTLGKFSESKLPSKAQVKELCYFLRPNFEDLTPLKRIFDTSDKQLERLTDEQYYILDGMADNNRSLVLGCAGTGKTLLAIHSALTHLNRGDTKVGFFCFNANLGNYLKSKMCEKELSNGSFVGTLHSYLSSFLLKKSIISFNDLDGSDPVFYSKTLPSLFVEHFNDEFDFEPFDVLVVDEAQDLVTDEYLLVFDCILKNGFDRGRWLFFADFANQDIYTIEHFSEEEAKRRLNDPPVFRLNSNCRNTHQICNEIENVANIKYKSIITQVDGSPVNYVEYVTDGDAVNKFDSLVQTLKTNHVNAEDIIVLSPKKKTDSFVIKSKFQIFDYPSDKKGIQFSTIQAFKGLESRIIILVDVESYSIEKLLYIGFSRARVGLFVFETNGAHHERIERMIKKHEGA